MKSRVQGLVVVFGFCFAMGVVAYFVGEAVVRRQRAAQVEPSWPDPVPSGILTQDESLPEPEVVVKDAEPEPEVVKDAELSYGFGYERGYAAFLEQQGSSVPVTRAVRYTNEVVDVGVLDEDLTSKGYADGYHKASDNFYCPCPVR